MGVTGAAAPAPSPPVWLEEDKINKLYNRLYTLHKHYELYRVSKVRIQLVDDVQVKDVMCSWGSDAERSEPF